MHLTPPFSHQHNDRRLLEAATLRLGPAALWSREFLATTRLNVCARIYDLSPQRVACVVDLLNAMQDEVEPEVTPTVGRVIPFAPRPCLRPE